MRTALSPVVDGVLALTGAPSRLRMHLHRHRVRQTQREILLRILRRASASSYGRRYDFATIRSEDEYISRLPVISYEDISEEIGRILSGEEGVLTSEQVLMLEPTSGGADASKHIPFTPSLLAQFQRAVDAWLFDLYSHRPRLLGGRAYFAVTPVKPAGRADGAAVPLGFQDDSEYLGPLSRSLLRRQQAVPPAVAALTSSENFIYATLLFLVSARDLTLVSVWSPAYLTRLLQQLPRFIERLVDDLSSGKISLIEPEAAGPTAALGSALRPDRERARELSAISDGSKTLGELVQTLWPRLSLISAWADANAADPAADLKKLFPESEFQPKGLLATEGVVSFPLIAHPAGAVLAIESHFFEFEDESGELLLADQLALDGQYSVRITTGGGLYRYRLGDRVRVGGFYGRIPLLTFEGRTDGVSDWYGEKLNQQHVERVLRELLPPSIEPSDLMLALERNPRPRYLLWVEASEKPQTALAALASALELRLRENHHYDLCRRTGQLGELELQQIPPGALARGMARRSLREGTRLGTQKPDLLARKADWCRFLLEGEVQS